MPKSLARVFLPVCLFATILAGCGDDGTGPGPAPGPPPRTGQLAQGQVELPAGTGLAVENLKILSSFGEYDVDANGGFAAEVDGPGPSLVMAVTGGDSLVLVGFVDPVSPTPGEISVHETATTALYFAMNLFSLRDSSAVQMVDTIRQHPATATLAGQMATTMADNPTFLTTGDVGLIEDLVEAAQSMLASKSPAAPRGEAPAKRLGLIQTTPYGEPTGVIVGAADEGGLQITNLKRRSLRYFLYKTGFLDGEGVQTDLSPPVPVTNGYLGATGGLTGVIGTFVDWATGNLGFQPVSLPEPIDLPVAVGENRALFEVIVAGSSVSTAGPAEPAWWTLSENPDKEDWRASATSMTELTVVKDIILPAIFSIFLPIGDLRSGNDIDVANLVNLLEALRANSVNATVQMSQGDWAGAASTVLHDIANSPEVRARLGVVLQTLWQAQFGEVSERVLLTLGRANYIVAAIDALSSVIDVGIVVADNVEVHPLDHWDVVSIPGVVRLAVERRTLTPDSFSTSIEASVVGAEPGTEFCYRWRLDPSVGDLYALGDLSTEDPPHAFVTDQSVVQYIIDPLMVTTGDLDTVIVEVYAHPETGCTQMPFTEALVGTAQVALRGLDDPECDLFDLDYWRANIVPSPTFEIELMTPVVEGGDPVQVRAHNISGGTAQLNLLVPTVYYNGEFAYPRAEHLSIEGGGENLSFYVADDGPLWHWFREDEVNYPLVSYGIDLRIQSVAPGATILISVPTSKEFGEFAAQRDCAFWALDGPGGTQALSSYGFVSELNGQFLDWIRVLEPSNP